MSVNNSVVRRDMLAVRFQFSPNVIETLWCYVDCCMQRELCRGLFKIIAGATQSVSELIGCSPLVSLNCNVDAAQIWIIWGPVVVIAPGCGGVGPCVRVSREWVE